MSTISRATILTAVPTAALFGGFLTSLVTAASAAPSKDIDLLNSAAIPLERAGIKAYEDAAALNILSPGVLTVAKGFLADHKAHLGALEAAVRAAGATPSTDVTALTYPPLKTQEDILKFAESVERTAASAYLSVFPVLEDKNLAKAAASILGIETMHVTVLAAALGQGIPYHGFIS
jgi:hypothetical protein